MLHLHKNDLDQHLPHRTVEMADDLPDLLRCLIVGDNDDVVRIRIHGKRGCAHAAVIIVLAAAAAAAGVAVSGAAEAAEAAEAAKATAATAAAGALLRVNFDGDAEKKNQNATHILFELLRFHNLSWC
jgi:hypothetical protein